MIAVDRLGREARPVRSLRGCSILKVTVLLSFLKHYFAFPYRTPHDGYEAWWWEDCRSLTRQPCDKPSQLSRTLFSGHTTRVGRPNEIAHLSPELGAVEIAVGGFGVTEGHHAELWLPVWTAIVG